MPPLDRDLWSWEAAPGNLPHRSIQMPQKGAFGKAVSEDDMQVAVFAAAKHSDVCSTSSSLGAPDRSTVIRLDLTPTNHLR